MSPVEIAQRLVVRMTVDPAFAADVLAGRVAVDPRVRTWILAVDPAVWTAERGRREQLLGNLAGEMPLACALAADGVLEAFASSPAFHQAIDAAESLPLAFAAWLETHAPPRARALTRLEAELVRARRLRPARPEAPIRFAPGVRLIALPSGTVEHASSVVAARAAGAPWPAVPARAGEERVVLAPRDRGRWASPDVHVEVVTGGVLAFLVRAERGMSDADISRFARRSSASRAEVLALARDLAAEGILDPSAAHV